MSDAQSQKRNDPLPAFAFKLVIDGVEGGSALFKSVSGLKSETEVVPYKEGGANGTTRQLIGATKWPNLVLKRGFVGAPFGLVRWRQSVIEHSNDRKGFKRLSGKIVQLRPDLSEVCSWTFVNGWPCRWEGPDFDASKSELAIETIEIAHEGLLFNG
jgi:phage tail-like protein